MPRSILMGLLGLLLLASPASPMPQGPAERRAGVVELLLEARGAVRDLSQTMEAARQIIERRIAALGSPGASVVRQGPNRILVRVRRRQDADQVRLLIGRPGRLSFRLVDDGVTEAQLRSGRAPRGGQILAYPEAGPGGRIAVQRGAVITGAMIADARPAFDELGSHSVTIRFDGEGSRRFALATQANVTRRFAIVVDNVVVSAPTIREPILGGTAQISGSFTRESANRLAISLRSGPLPIDLVLIEERRVRD